MSKISIFLMTILLAASAQASTGLTCESESFNLYLPQAPGDGIYTSSVNSDIQGEALSANAKIQVLTSSDGILSVSVDAEGNGNWELIATLFAELNPEFDSNNDDGLVPQYLYQGSVQIDNANGTATDVVTCSFSN